MEGLYKKVIRGNNCLYEGIYPRVPPEYSSDLSTVVKMLLNVTAHLRPACGTPIDNLEKILEMPQVTKRLEDIPNTESESTLSLLNTIRIQRDFRNQTTQAHHQNRNVRRKIGRDFYR
jgi:NIMA (never in mitosis gene a)-related kinase